MHLNLQATASAADPFNLDTDSNNKIYMIPKIWSYMILKYDLYDSKM